MHSRFRGKALPLLPHSSAVAATQHCHPDGIVLSRQRHNSLTVVGRVNPLSPKNVAIFSEPKKDTLKYQWSYTKVSLKKPKTYPCLYKTCTSRGCSMNLMMDEAKLYSGLWAYCTDWISIVTILTITERIG